MKRWLLVLVPLIAGCTQTPQSDRLYCKECKEIRALQAKPEPTSQDLQDIERLQKEMEKKLMARAAFRRIGDDAPVDLHPGCDCPCHYVRL